MPKFAFNVIKNDKIFEIAVNGFFQEEDAKQFLEGYSTNVKSFNPKEYSLIVDASKMSIIKADLTSGLEQCFKLYMSTGFKKIIIITPEDVIEKMQFERLSKDVNLNADLVINREEAIKIAKS
ncbi:MAG TPA: hypothetical protein VHY08_03625 [Bacillota bacterium]|nr:hypothetical protein [Bacillota bacterium]